VPFSTNVERVALAAARKEIELEWIDVDTEKRTPSRQPLVPVLEPIDRNDRLADWIRRVDAHPRA
jgi:glutathione S-transferase